MASRSSVSRSLMAAAGASLFRPSPSLNAPRRLRPSSLPSSRRRFSFSNPSTLGEIGCSQSLLALTAGARLTSHLAVNLRAFCELSHGT